MSVQAAKRNGLSARKASRAPRGGEPLQSTSFAALPEEIARWKARAAQEQRSYGWWIRNRLLAADARDEESVARAAERES